MILYIIGVILRKGILYGYRKNLLWDFFKDDNSHIVYVEEKTIHVNLRNLNDSLIQEKQALLEIQICMRDGYKTKIVEKVLGTANEYLVTGKIFRLLF